MSFGLVNTLPLYVGTTPSRALTAVGAYSAAADTYAAYVTTLAPLYNTSVAQINAFIADMAAFSALNPITGGGTSVSNLSIPGVIGTAVNFVIVEANRLFRVGSFFIAAVTATPTANYMVVQVTGWNSGTSTLSGVVASFVGAGGPFNAWTISPSAPPQQNAQVTGGNAAEAGSVVLTATSGFAHIDVFTAQGQGWTLPDGTTMLAAGEAFALTNKSAYFARITDSAGLLRCFVAPYETVRVALASNAHATNNWTFDNGKMLGVTANFESPTAALASGINQFTALPLDATRTMLLLSVNSSSPAISCVVYDSSQAPASQWGAVTAILVGSAGNTTFFKATLLAANVVVVFTGITGGLAGVRAIPLSIAGTAVTPGTAASIGGAAPTRLSDAVVLGTGAFVTYTIAATLNLAGVTVAANVAAWGAAQALAAAGAASTDVSDLYVSGATLMAIYHNATANTLAATPYTAVGATLTPGTTATNANFASFGAMRTIAIAAGAWAAVLNDITTGTDCAYITLAGTVATIANVNVSTSALGAGAGNVSKHDMTVANGKLVWMFCDSTATVAITVLTFTGAAVTTNDKQTFQWFTGAAAPVLMPVVSGNVARALLVGTSGIRVYNIDVSAGTAVVTQRHIYGGQDLSTPNASGAKGRRDGKTMVSSKGLIAAIPVWASGAYNKRNTSLVFGADREYEMIQDIPECGSFADIGNSNAESWLMADTAAGQSNGGLFLQRIEMGAA